MEMLADRISRKMADGTGMAPEDMEVLVHCMFCLLSAVTHTILIAAATLPFGLLPEAACYTLAFMALKRYAGGWHCAREWQCQIVFTAAALLSAAAARRIAGATWAGIATAALWLFCLALVLLRAPVPSAKRPVAERLLARYRQRSITVVCLLPVPAAAWAHLGRESLATAVILGGLTTAVLLLERRETDEGQENP